MEPSTSARRATKVMIPFHPDHSPSTLSGQGRRGRNHERLQKASQDRPPVIRYVENVTPPNLRRGRTTTNSPELEGGERAIQVKYQRSTKERSGKDALSRKEQSQASAQCA